MRIGFLRLLDAAPLIVAGYLGYFKSAGVSVSLHRQTGWMNARDQLISGFLDASQAPIGMPIMSQIGRSGFQTPLVAVMNLGSGGNVLVVCRALAAAGVDSVAGLAALVGSPAFARTFNRMLIGSYVSNYSAQYYLLRNCLAAAGMTENRHIRLTSLMPAQVPEHLAHGYVDICCVSEPWGMRCVAGGWGTVIGATCDIMVNHPEKVLAVREQFAAACPDDVSRALQAVLCGVEFCRQPKNLDLVVDVLSRSEHLGESPEIIRASLRAGVSDAFPVPQTADSCNGSSTCTAAAKPARWSLGNCFPDVQAMEWFLDEMVKWNDLTPSPVLPAVARRSVNGEFFRIAAARLGLSASISGMDISTGMRPSPAAGLPAAV